MQRLRQRLHTLACPKQRTCSADRRKHNLVGHPNAMCLSGMWRPYLIGGSSHEGDLVLVHELEFRRHLHGGGRMQHAAHALRRYHDTEMHDTETPAGPYSCTGSRC